MIPPCDPAILSANPHFKALHQQLTTAILNPDGSTRAHGADPSRRAVQADMKKYLVRAVKARILRRVVGQVAAAEGVDEELQHLVSIIVLYLQHVANNSKLSTCAAVDQTDDLLSLLAPDLQRFHAAIPSLIPKFTAILSADLAHLKSLANASPPNNTNDNNNNNNNNSNNNNGNPNQQFQSQSQSRPRTRLHPLSLKPSPSDVSLSTTLSNRLRTLRTIQSHELPTARTKMTVTAAGVLAAHARVMERVIHVLERTKHGGLARAARARAEHVAVVLEGVEGKVCIMRHEMLSAIYTPETTAALAHYRDHLEDTRLRLEERRKNALVELEGYERADLEGGGDFEGEGNDNVKAGAMVEIARRYGALNKEVEGVKMEIRRLGG